MSGSLAPEERVGGRKTEMRRRGRFCKEQCRNPFTDICSKQAEIIPNYKSNARIVFTKKTLR